MAAGEVLWLYWLGEFYFEPKIPPLFPDCKAINLSQPNSKQDIFSRDFVKINHKTHLFHVILSFKIGGVSHNTGSDAVSPPLTPSAANLV